MTVAKLLDKLKSKGYTEDLSLKKDHLHYASGDLKLGPEDFEIDHTYRFEGESNPSDSSIVYAISSEKHDLKGTFVNAYGAYSELLSDRMIEKLGETHH